MPVLKVRSDRASRSKRCLSAPQSRATAARPSTGPGAIARGRCCSRAARSSTLASISTTPDNRTRAAIRSCTGLSDLAAPRGEVGGGVAPPSGHAARTPPVSGRERPSPPPAARRHQGPKSRILRRPGGKDPFRVAYLQRTCGVENRGRLVDGHPVGELLFPFRSLPRGRGTPGVAPSGRRRSTP